MICDECGGTFYETTEPITEEFRGEVVTVIGIRHWRCPGCGNTAFDFPYAEECNRSIREAARRKKEGRKATERAAAELSEALIA